MKPQISCSPKYSTLSPTKAHRKRKLFVKVLKNKKQDCSNTTHKLSINSLPYSTAPKASPFRIKPNFKPRTTSWKKN
jgi:hypothetical protein